MTTVANSLNTSKSLRIAYLSTKYPSVSHTFIRRELLELERRGHKILRLAIRSSDNPLVDPLDQQEQKKTIHCLNLPVLQHLSALLRIIITRPHLFFNALGVTISMGLRSDRGLLKHIAYLLEACTFIYVLKKHNIQHIHAHFGTNSTAVARLIHLCGGPSYSFTVHGPGEFDSAISFDLNGKISDSLFVVAITDFCKAQLQRWSSFTDWEKIHVVHCTVGDNFFNATRSIDQNNHTFVSIGRLNSQKGQVVLLEAFAQLIAKGYRSNLVLVGDGELRCVIEEKIRSQKLEEHVTITGFVSETEIQKHIINSRALVMPSFAEGLPMVIMEAFAIGRPVISTWIAGIPELVRPEKNGWLVPAANTQLLVDAMIGVLQASSKDLEGMAAIGRKMTYSHHHTVTEGNRLNELFLHYIAKQ